MWGTKGIPFLGNPEAPEMGDEKVDESLNVKGDEKVDEPECESELGCSLG